ncbi:MAG: 3'-5' exonuclease [Candidatus Omnitrophota bacterium]|nr:3'-5' exonuclease [Candidatus Omnitrophota bacterium]
MDLNKNIEDFDLVFFDLETTGLNVAKGDSICEIGALKIRDRKITDKFSSLVNPKKPIPQEASSIHKIYDRDVQGAPYFEQIANKLVKFFQNSIILAYNIEFDISFLSYELNKINSAIPILPAIDILCMARKTLRLDRYNLKALCSFFDIEHTGELHRALADSFVVSQAFFKLRDILKEGKLENLADFISLYGLNNEIFKLKEEPKVSLVKEAITKQLYLKARYFSYRNTMEEEAIKPVDLSQENNNFFLWCQNKAGKGWRINLNRLLDIKMI